MLPDQLRHWRRAKQELGLALERFQRDKAGVIERLRAFGIRSASDLKEDATARLYAEELLEVERQIAALRSKGGVYETAIVQIESSLRRLERRRLLKNVGITEDELNELSQSVLELEERLR